MAQIFLKQMKGVINFLFISNICTNFNTIYSLQVTQIWELLAPIILSIVGANSPQNAVCFLVFGPPLALESNGFRQYLFIWASNCRALVIRSLLRGVAGP